MAGHSKWANIKHRKGAQDARRAKIFTKLLKEITVAVKEGGPDTDSNARLRLAVQNAKGKNLPKDNIDRAIKKGSGSEGDDYQEVNFEGYGANGVAIFVECTTDNNNRTVSNVRSYFTKHGSGLAKSGSVEFLFDRKGVFMVEKPEEGFDEDEFTLEMIDGGAEDVEVDEELISVTCVMADFGNMQKKFEEMGIEPKEAGLERIPTTTVELGDEDLKKVMKLIDALEDDDDVQKVYHNMEISDDQIELI